MPDDVRIALTAASDIDAIHAIETASFPSPWRREFFDNELHGSGRFCLSAKRGATIVGYLFSMWFFDEMHINKIAVVESQRRAGIANALMKECLDFAKEHGIKTISLEVRKSNKGAQEFYRMLHFVPQYTRPRYYPDGETAVVMIREV